MRIKEVPVTNHPHIYRLIKVDSSGKAFPVQKFRVRRRVKGLMGWTMQTRTFESFEAAKAFLREPLIAPADLAEGSLLKLGSQADSGIFLEVFKRFLNHKKVEIGICEATLFQYRKLANHFKFFEKMEASKINPKVIDCWINLLNDPDYKALQHGSRVNYEHEYVLLGNVLRFYREYENETFNFPLLLRHRKRLCSKPRKVQDEIKFLSTPQKVEFLKVLFENQDGIFYEIATLQCETGMRIGEVLALEFHQISFHRNEIAVNQHLHWERHAQGKTILIPGTKGGPSRVIPMTTKCRTILDQKLKNRQTNRVFELNGKWVMYRRVQHVYDDMFRKLEIPHSGTHTLRHTFAVEFLDKTKDIYALQKLLGHAELTTTQVYAKYSNESVRKSFEIFNGGKLEEVGGVVSQLVSRLKSADVS